jgi:hypothetical protein
MSARTAVPGDPLDDGDEVPLSLPDYVDRYCGPGWSRAWPAGAETFGADARFVLPLSPSLAGADLVVTLDVRSLGGHQRFEVTANESVVTAALAAPENLRIACLIDAPIVGRFRPLELALRRPLFERLRGRGELRLQVASVRVERAKARPSNSYDRFL